MNMDVLKCKTVDGVLEETYVFALVYNLVRVVLQSGARRQHLPIARLSHIDAFRWLASANASSSTTWRKAYCQRPNAAPFAPGNARAITWPHPTGSRRALEQDEEQDKSCLILRELDKK